MFLWTFYFYLMVFLFMKGSTKNWIIGTLNKNYTNIQVIENKSSFWEAKSFCLKEFNSVIMMVKNKDDSDKLIEILRKGNISSAWIGLSDFGRERQFYWTSDHSNISFELWEKGFPKDERNASDCVLVQINEEGVYKWIDCHCASKHPFVCMYTNTSDNNKSALLPSHAHYLNQCRKPFYPVDGDCFWMTPNPLSWSDSRQLCQSISPESDLASIRTKFQQEYFAALISGSTTGYWIGLNFYGDAYQWILQHDVKIERWGKNQPKDETKRNCTFISNNEHNLGDWYSAPCSERFSAICQTLVKNNDSEINYNPNTTTDMTYDNFLFKKGECQKADYYFYHGSCYRLHHDKQLNHDDALNFCHNETFRNGSKYNFLVELVSVLSAGERNFILADLRRLGSFLTNNTVWINMNEVETEEMKSSQMQIFKTIPSKQIDKTIPSKQINYGCFRLFTNGIIFTSDCDYNSKSFPMCKYQLNNFNIKSLKSNRLTAICPAKWTLFNSFCYYFNNGIYKSQYDAKKKCFKMNGSLISIDMHLEEFLRYSSRDFDLNIWIGLEAEKTNNARLRFKWINETPITYMNLENINTTGNPTKWCAVFVIQSGLWRLTSCIKNNASLVCQQPAYITSLQNSNKKISRYAKLGYIFKTDFLSWKNANNKCRGLKTELGLMSIFASINGYEDLNKILVRKSGSKYRFAWIGLSGLYDHFDNVFLHWTDGSRVVFQNYQLENLMNLTGSENCVKIDLLTGKWHASDCNAKLPYFCRIISTTSLKEDQPPESRLSHVLASNHDLSNQACPEHFHEFSQKCYRVIDNESMDWIAADKYCQQLVPEEFHVRASLASIESKFENSFVYSLLSQNMYSQNNITYWIGERYTSIDSFTSLCAGMSGHPDPYIGARWFTEDCSKKMEFICSSLKVPISKHSTVVSSCRNDDVEYNSSMGTNCYHFDDVTNDYAGARVACNFFKPNSLLSIPSHYHMHFLLSQYEKLGWSRDTPVWLGSEIEQNQKLFHWQWNDGQIIRYTIWNKVPNLTQKTGGNLCMYFIPEKDKRGRLGIQIEECHKLTFKGYIICESLKNIVFVQRAPSTRNCLTDSRGDTYEGEMNNTVNGLRCLRWDLLRRPNVIVTNIRGDSSKHNYIQYHSNECRYITNMQQSTTSCLISLDSVNGSVQLQECPVGLCSHKVLIFHQVHHSNIMTVIIVTLLLLVCVIACIALLSWRRWNRTSLFGGYLRRGQFSMLNTNQSRGTSFNNPIYSPVNC